MKLLQAAKRAMGIEVVDVAKRDGVIVMRPLEPRNAKKWHDWAVKHGVPNPVPPEEMHVTIVYSKLKDAKVPLAETVVNISTTESYAPGFFAMFGPEEDTVVFTFFSYALADRHWTFLAAGCECDWPSYRPHLSLSLDAPGFELPDAAMEDVPSLIVLLPEVSMAPKVTAADLQKSGGADDSLLEVSEEAIAAAAGLLEAKKDGLTALDVQDLIDISHGRMSKGVAKRLADLEWAPAELKAAAVATPVGQKVQKRLQREVTVQVSNLPAEILKSLRTAEVMKGADEEQIVMGIASVSTVKGELVEDSHGDFVTTQALVEFNRSLISTSRDSKLMHAGEARAEVVAGLVFSDTWQKALGIDLGYEPYLVEIHVSDADLWAEVKKGDWMLSIAGLMWYYEEDEGDADL